MNLTIAQLEATLRARTENRRRAEAWLALMEQLERDAEKNLFDAQDARQEAQCLATE